MKKCVFCEAVGQRKNIIHEDEFVFAIRDKYPVSKGHVLIIPKRHIESLDNLNNEEWKAIFQTLKSVKKLLDKKLRPDGYNFGINIGEYAGQTVEHVHFHLIPRFIGDVEVYEGGIRNIVLSERHKA